MESNTFVTTKSSTQNLPNRVGFKKRKLRLAMQKVPPPFRKAAFLLLFVRQKVGQKEKNKFPFNNLL